METRLDGSERAESQTAQALTSKAFTSFRWCRPEIRSFQTPNFLGIHIPSQKVPSKPIQYINTRVSNYLLRGYVDPRLLRPPDREKKDSRRKNVIATHTTSLKGRPTYPLRKSLETL